MVPVNLVNEVSDMGFDFNLSRRTIIQRLMAASGWCGEKRVTFTLTGGLRSRSGRFACLAAKGTGRRELLPVHIRAFPRPRFGSAGSRAHCVIAVSSSRYLFSPAARSQADLADDTALCEPVRTACGRCRERFYCVTRPAVRNDDRAPDLNPSAVPQRPAPLIEIGDKFFGAGRSSTAFSCRPALCGCRT